MILKLLDLMNTFVKSIPSSCHQTSPLRRVPSHQTRTHPNPKKTAPSLYSANVALDPDNNFSLDIRREFQIILQEYDDVFLLEAKKV